MQKVLLPFLLIIISQFSIAQKISIATDRNNVLYLEVENPITIAVENISCKALIVQTNNGTMVGGNGNYICKPHAVGKSVITVFVKQDGKLKKIGESEFRVKRMIDLPDIVFRIGPCGNDCTISKSVLESQDYVRGDVENTEFDAVVGIDSFSVYIYSNTSCTIKHNTGNKISDELKREFHLLKANDIVVFRNIYALLADNTSRQIAPVMLFIKE